MLDADIPAADVLAVVVTYNPGADLVRNLQALRSQIGEVLVVDNGSNNVEAVRTAVAATGCLLEENGSNLGIAAALNRGVARALAKGSSWLATFDQDSLLPEHAIRELLAQHARHPQRQEIGIVVPRHRDRGTQADYFIAADIISQDGLWRVVRCAITSGSLIRSEVLRAIGGFEEKLFIDSVDHEFCLRMRKRGWMVAEYGGVIMEHSVGAATVHKLLGMRVTPSHHAPIRRYYITRNLLEVSVRNLFFDPVWSLKALMQLAAGMVVSVTYERDRLAKFLANLAGARDFLLRRFGKRS